MLATPLPADTSPTVGREPRSGAPSNLALADELEQPDWRPGDEVVLIDGETTSGIEAGQPSDRAARRAERAARRACQTRWRMATSRRRVWPRRREP